MRKNNGSFTTLVKYGESDVYRDFNDRDISNLVELPKVKPPRFYNDFEELFDKSLADNSISIQLKGGTDLPITVLGLMKHYDTLHSTHYSDHIRLVYTGDQSLLTLVMPSMWGEYLNN